MIFIARKGTDELNNSDLDNIKRIEQAKSKQYHNNTIDRREEAEELDETNEQDADEIPEEIPEEDNAENLESDEQPKGPNPLETIVKEKMKPSAAKTAKNAKNAAKAMDAIKKIASSTGKAAASLTGKIAAVISKHPYGFLAIVIIAAVVILLIVLFIFLVILLIVVIDSEDGTSNIRRYVNCRTIRVTGDHAGVYDLEEYIAGVVQSEVGGAGIETMKAQAIAARNFLVVTTDDCTRPIDNNEGTQTFVPPTNEQAIQAAEETASELMLDKNGELFAAYYSSYPKEDFNGFPAFPACGPIECEEAKEGEEENRECTTTLYTMPYENESSSSFEFTMPERDATDEYWNGASLEKQEGHCYGMSQVGAMYLEEEKGYNYEQILAEFYDIENIAGFGALGSIEWDGFEYDCSGLSYVWGSPYEGHTGIDIKGSWNGNINTEIYSLTPGTVWKVDNGTTTLGKYVIINSNIGGQDMLIAYGHMQEVNSSLSPGQEVLADTPLGIQGKTGRTVGSEPDGGFTHVHLETRVSTGSGSFWNNSLINPPTNVFSTDQIPFMYCKRVPNDSSNNKKTVEKGD